MKKLMTVIAAVAMSFGLFAADASHFISFETADECVQDGKLVKTGWTGDASVIGLVGGYNYKGADARRDADGEPGFEGGTENLKCLKLETGSNQVVCTPGGDTDNIYFDQTVKFTGYEEAPTVTGGKIAVWMSGIEAEGTEGEDGYIAGETNLYVTCAKVNAAGEATPTNICIGAYDIDAWHRVTIKSLGDIAANGGRAGFLVYIDGAQVGSFAGIADADALAEKFQSYSASGLLFPALDADDATVTAVAYQGIGELDDVAIDNLGPQFARFVEGTVVAVPHAGLLLTDADGNEITVDEDGKFQAAPGATLNFAYTAEDGYFFKGGVLTQNFPGKAERDADPFDFRNDLDAKVAVAKYADIEGNELYAASIQEAVENDEFGMITLVTNAVLTASVDMAGFSGEFDLAGFTVSGTWATSYANPGAGRQYLFEIGSDADVAVYGGTITSTGKNIGAFHVVGGTLSLDDVTVNASWRAIGAYDGATVEVGKNAVLTTAGEDPTIFIWSNFTNRSDTEVQCSVTIAGQVSNTFAGPYTCANLDAVIMGSGNDKFAGVELTIEEGAVIAGTTCSGIYFPCAGTLDVNGKVSGGKFGIYAKSGTVTIGEGAEIASTAEAAVAPTANNNGVNGAGNAVVLESGSAQGGYANNIVAEITAGTFESVGAGVYNFVREGADPIAACIEDGLFSNDLTDINLIVAEEGRRGKWEPDEQSGYYKPTTELINYVAQIGGEKFETIAQALAAAESGDVIELLAAVTIDADTIVATDITLALGAYNLVIAADKTLTINDDVTVTRTTGGVQNLGSISVAAAKTLDMATFGWGAGLIPAADDQTTGKFAIAGTVKFAAGTDPVAMATVNPGFFDGTVNGAKFIAGAVEYTYTNGEWKLPVVTYDITIGTLDHATLTIDGETAANFKAEEGKTYVLAVAPVDDGYENAKIYFNGAEIAAGNYVFTEAGTLTADAQKKQQGWPEEGDPTIIDKTAAQAFEGKIPPVLADVPAQKFTVWAKNKSGLDFATCTATDVDVDAYLLDCTPGEVAAEKAKAVSAIKITSITFDGEKWVITSGDYSENSAYGANAKVHFKPVEIEGADTTNAGFWQATLVPDTTPAN